MEVLNRAGSEGWELVSVTNNGIAYVKRQMPEPAKAVRRRAASVPAQE